MKPKSWNWPIISEIEEDAAERISVKMSTSSGLEARELTRLKTDGNLHHADSEHAIDFKGEKEEKKSKSKLFQMEPFFVIIN